ncbi:sarcosine oxidase subunit delta [Spiribacter salinus M19-40]|uniref:Sarcosine oxidase subunit delta n=1 Tax=Spiribacter salinus M19-40 TaxID=1260251 RepID=R4V5F9_9GAMM|nr:sarcosine oxidase subunit delta [Spiribacter salinus]AGM41164.1 sarcosine oxidase subunit delta [Spiribacter salinus M19-40]
MRIHCPFCGERDEHEFSYGGDAMRLRPDESNTDQTCWSAYVFLRDNPRGWHQEYWQHVHGCRAWICVTRNTMSHEVRRVCSAQERVKELRAEASQ